MKPKIFTAMGSAIAMLPSLHAAAQTADASSSGYHCWALLMNSPTTFDMSKLGPPCTGG